MGARRVGLAAAADALDIGALGTFQTMWLGFAMLIAYLQLAAFVMPIGTAALVVSFVPALAGYALQRRVVARRLRLGDRRAVLATGAAVACMLVVIVYLASDYVSLYDTGLYHLQAVKWNASYSIVPGLANLEPRLGYNNSCFLFASYVDAFWEGIAVHATSGFLFAAVFAQSLVEIFSARSPAGRLRQVYCLLALPFWAAKLWGSETASLSSDLALAAVSFAAVLELLALPRVSRTG